MVNFKEIIATAKKCQCWSMNHKYNYGPLDYLQREVLYKNGYSERNHKLYQKLVRFVTDAHTWFIYNFISYDYYVRCGQLIYKVQQSFPEVSKQTIWHWIKEEKMSHQVLC